LEYKPIQRGTVNVSVPVWVADGVGEFSDVKSSSATKEELPETSNKQSLPLFQRNQSISCSIPGWNNFLGRGQEQSDSSLPCVMANPRNTQCPKARHGKADISNLRQFGNNAWLKSFFLHRLQLWVTDAFQSTDHFPL
jgi:hypothetical protein